MKLKHLTEKTFLLYAAQNYDNPECVGIEEFHEDLNRIRYVKRILRKYHKNKTADENSIRLALNHAILLINVFGPKTASELLFFRLDSFLFPYIKTILVYLHSMPKIVNGINTNDIPLDINIIKILREI